MLRLHLTILDFNLVAGEDDGNIFANTSEITMPVGNIFVGNARRHVEHDNGALTLDVVPITKASEFLLAGGVPDVEFDKSSVGVEDEGVDFDSEGGHVLFLELSRQVPLDEGGFPHPAVANEDELKFWNIVLLSLCRR